MSEEIKDASEIVKELSVKKEVEQAKYYWDENFQKRIVGLALTDSEFLVQAYALIKPEYFSSEALYLIAKVLFNYYGEKKNLPDMFVVKHLVQNEVKDKEDAIKIYYDSEVDSLYEAFVPTANSREILTEKILKFARLQELKIAVSISMKELKENPESDDHWSKADERIRQALQTTKSVDIGYDFLPNRELFYDKLGESLSGVERFSCGFNKIESIVSGGWQRGELHAFMALTGQGKSLALSKLTCENLKRNKKVVYISLELAWVTVCQRFVGQFTGTDVNAILENRLHIEELFNEFLKEQTDKNLLNIKQYALGTPTVADVKAYLAKLRSAGFSFDVVIVDYAGEFKPVSNVKTYESQAIIMRELKALAQEENCVVVTAIQSNKDGARLGDSESLGLSNIAASFDQAQKLDGIWSITRSPSEVEAGYGRITGVKVRNGTSGISFPVKFDRKTLDIHEVSEEEYNQAMHYLAVEKASHLDVDSKPKKKKVSEDLSSGE